MDPLVTGRYRITNVKYKNSAGLPNGNFKSPIVASSSQDGDPGQIWNIKRLSNEKYLIENNHFGVHANRLPCYFEGENVFGGKLALDWYIRELTTYRGNYIIFTDDTDALLWSLPDGGDRTPIVFKKAHNDTRNQWVFTKVPDDSENVSKAMGPANQHNVQTPIPDTDSVRHPKAANDERVLTSTLMNMSSVESSSQEISNPKATLVEKSTSHDALQLSTNVISRSIPSETAKPKVGQAQITFTIGLVVSPLIEGSPRMVDLKRVAWQVFDIDGPKCHVELKLPSLIGFGTIGFLQDSDDIFDTLRSVFGPPGSLFTLQYQDGARWLSSFELPKPNDCLIRAKNETGVSRRFALGSRDPTSSRLQPFLVTGHIPTGHILCVEPKLVLQAYRTQNLRTGQLITVDSVLSDSQRLFDEEGIEILELPPLVTWSVKFEKSGRIKLDLQGAK